MAVAVVGPFVALPIASLHWLVSFRGMPFLIVVVAASAIGQLVAGMVAIVISVILLDFRFFGGLGLSSASESSIVVFSVIGVLVAYLVAERDRAAAWAQDNAERLELLAHAGDLLADPMDYEATLRDLGALLVPRLADWFSVDLVEGDGIRNALVVHPDPSMARLARELQRRFPTDPNSPTGAPRVIRTGRSELTETITEEMLRSLIADPELLSSIHELGLRCAMVVPLTARGRTFGAVTLVGAETHSRYGPRDLQLAEEIADRAALAIDTAKLFSAESEARAAATQQARRNTVLKDVTAAFGLARTVDGVMGAMLDGIRMAGAVAGTVGLVREDGRVDLVGTSGYEPDDHPYWRSFGLDEQLPLSEAIRERRPVVLSTTQERDGRYPSLAGRGEQRDHALVCLPLLLGTASIGGFSASYPPETHFGDDDLSFLRAIGEQCAQAIDRARSAERERDARARFDALAKASRALALTLDYDRTAETVVRLAADHLGGRATLYARDGEGLTLAAEAEAADGSVSEEGLEGAAAIRP
jgi:GAF domain-containing protein